MNRETAGCQALEGRVGAARCGDPRYARPLRLSEETYVTRWRGLYRDGLWMTVVRDLQRHLHGLAGADGYALWAQLPPDGHWLRIAWARTALEPACLPADTEPLVSVRNTLRPCRSVLPRVGDRYRELLERIEMAGTWALPLILPSPDDQPGQLIGVMGFGSRGTPPAEPPALDAQLTVVAYLLMQRVQEELIDGLLTWMASQPPPAGEAEWAPLLAEIAGWMGGDQWVLLRLPPGVETAGAWDLVAESGLWPGAGARWLAWLRRQAAPPPGIALRALTQRRVDFVADLLAEADGSAARSNAWLVGEFGLRSAVALPLGVRGHGDAGLLVSFWRETEGWKRFTALARPWEALRRNLAVWWQEASDTRQLLTDPLTGVFNRRGVDQMWRGGSAAVGRVGILDCDRFHRVNNLWGHLMGDEVLRVLGATLREESDGNGGWCGRWGGDEFVVALPREQDWRQFGWRVSQALDGWAREHGWPQHVSLSGGAVTWRGERPAWEDVLAAADRVLYEIKESGGGRFLSRRLPVRAGG